MSAQCLQKGCGNPPARMGYRSGHYQRRLSAATKIKAQAEAMPAREIHESEFLYVIGISGNPFYKVGRSLDPVKRMANLQCSIPIDLTLEAAFCVASSAASRLEGAAHKALVAHNTRGEWFRTDKAEIIKTVKVCADQIEAVILDPVAALAICRDDTARTGGRDEMLGFEDKLKRIMAVIAAA